LVLQVFMMTYDQVTADMVEAIQEVHKANLNLSATTIGERLGLNLSPVTIVRVIEGKFNYLVELNK